MATILLLTLTGCDDGDITFNDFDFSGSNGVKHCNDSNLYYIVNGTEVIILELSPSVLYNIASEEPVTVSLGSGANTITYRNYSGEVNNNDNNPIICGGSTSANDPVIIEEWTGEGTISVTTIKDINDDGKLVNYIHTINLDEIVFTNGESTIIVNDNLFGSYETQTVSFGYGNEENPLIQACNEDISERLYKISGQEVIILNLAPDFIENTEGQQIISFPIEDEEQAEVFEILFEKYNGSVTNSVICSDNRPVTPVIQQRWRVAEGDLIVTTTEDEASPGTFLHEIKLKDIIFSRSDVNSGENFEVYEMLEAEIRQEVQDNGGFILGTYVTQVEE
ncbi:hypothetical protein GCM10007424_01100 [Flavobacterium suaedae]|uniref:Lipocalin-like domain-containing protein n=2 Tax=Flavobacterium suaedae TaxID=1767027 RepID=A0ABQ1JBW7_9FLAO|nr:hypothetical protein GCM10007424_01100 [Flavobacterium suaedae]